MQYDIIDHIEHEIYGICFKKLRESNKYDFKYIFSYDLKQFAGPKK